MIQQLLPHGFCFLSDIDDTIIQNARYFSHENFLGRPVNGYQTNQIICTKDLAESLKKAHDIFKNHGYNIVVYDAYRPIRAVEEFKQWRGDVNDIAAKEYYYPHLSKKEIFELGYIAERSTHSRGSTVDLTLIEIGQKLKPITYSKRIVSNGDVIVFLDDNTVDMGSSFDLFHEISHPGSDLISQKARNNRVILRETLIACGFRGCKTEWWHYTLENEPYPDTYFDFVANIRNT